MRKCLGFEEWFDFSHKHSFGGKVKNLLFVFALNLLWTAAVSATLIFLVRLNRVQVATILTDFIGKKTLYTGLLLYFTNPIMLFLAVCIFAPLWEEVAFRAFPIELARLLGVLQKIKVVSSDDDAAAGRKPGFLFWMCCFSSIIFGLTHGSVMAILFQGVYGLLYSWIYLKNNRSYLSAVAAHGLWNFMLLFGLQIVLAL